MEIMEIIHSRHSVRQYLAKEIPEEIQTELNAYTDSLNRESGLHIQIFYNEPECFGSRLARYGRFENADNYISIVGKKGSGLEERSGYYGEQLVLKAQELGLNTCWVALTHGKSKAKIAPGEKEVIIISLGYGKTPGVPHRGKEASGVSNVSDDSPEWFKRGVEAALLAPTAVNQQKFRLERDGDRVKAKTGLIGSYLKVDLGIVKCHFELAAGRENFSWM